MEIALPRSRHTLERPRAKIAPDEPLPVALHRITVDLLARAISDLHLPPGQSFDASVHSARKKLKRLRGLLRLIRDQTGYRSYREENVVLRDTARKLSGLRDAWILRKTLGDLRSDYRDLLDDDTFAAPEAWLLHRYETRRRVVTLEAVNGAITNLGSARSRFARYPINDFVANDFGAVAPGVRRVYRRGRRGHDRGVETRTVEDLHEWRKRVKYLRYQMETFTPLQPTLIGALAEELDVLGELLGDDHDLAVLADVIREHPESCRDERERWMLIALIYERRLNLQLQAFRLGDALYSEQPDAFVDRIGAYWEAGRR